MVESGRHPCCLSMALLAGGRELGRGMRRIVGLVVIICMTTVTKGWDLVIVVAGMAICASHRGVRPGKDIVVIMNSESCRFPSW